MIPDILPVTDGKITIGYPKISATEKKSESSRIAIGFDRSPSVPGLSETISCCLILSYRHKKKHFYFFIFTQLGLMFPSLLSLKGCEGEPTLSTRKLFLNLKAFQGIRMISIHPLACLTLLPLAEEIDIQWDKFEVGA